MIALQNTIFGLVFRGVRGPVGAFWGALGWSFSLPHVLLSRAPIRVLKPLGGLKLAISSSPTNYSGQNLLARQDNPQKRENACGRFVLTRKFLAAVEGSELETACLTARKGGEKPIKIPDEIFATVKKTVCHFGQFQPTLFVYGTKGRVFTVLPFGETSDERVEIMTQAGIQFARRSDIGDVERVIFVSEAWVSPPRTPYIPPSQDPDKMEVLLFNSLDARTNTQELEIYTCVRNGRQEVTDLKPLKQPDGGTVDGRLLPAFLAGFRLFRR